jgi:hypothetical protein
MGQILPEPAHVEFVGMIDPVRDSFHDLLLSDFDCGLSTPSNGARHDPIQECFMTSTLESCTLAIDSPKGTPISVTIRVAAFAPPHFSLTHQGPP